MSMPLYYVAKPKIEPLVKTAAGGNRIDEDSEKWPQEILKTAYREQPWLNNYATDIELSRMEPGRGFCTGTMIVYPVGMDKTAAKMQGRMIEVPIVLKNSDLQPLDVFIHESDFHMMEQDKVAQILFTPASFGGTRRKKDKYSDDLSDQFKPPISDSRFTPGVTKHASVGILEAALANSEEPHRKEMLARIASHEYTRRTLKKTAADQLLKIIGTKEKTAADMRRERVLNSPVSVMQFAEAGLDYRVWQANNECYNPITMTKTAHEVRDMIGDSAMSRLREKGYLTVVFGEPAKALGGKIKVAEANTFGMYRTVAGGEEVTGVVVPSMVSLGGLAMRQSVFIGKVDSTDRAFHGMQEKIAGAYMGPAVLEGQGAVRGVPGVFVYGLDQNRAIVTEPVVIEHQVKVAGVPQLLVKRVLSGQEATVMQVPGLKQLVKTGSASFSIPPAPFIPLPGSHTQLPEYTDTVEEAMMSKVAHVQGAVRLCGNTNDQTWWIDKGSNAGPFLQQSMNKTAMLFALGTLGIPEARAEKVMEKAASAGEVWIPSTRRVVTEADRYRSGMLKVAKVLAPGFRPIYLEHELAVLTTPPTGMLEKVSSVLLRKETVDAVLSLGLVNPENARVYTGYIPSLEKAASQLAEVLVASRLGFDEVRESAAKNAMIQVNSVIQGLKHLDSKLSH